MDNENKMADDGISPDAEALRVKEKVLERQRLNARFTSFGDTFKFLAAVTLAAGMAIIGSALKGVTWATLGSALVGEPVGLIFLGTAAVLTAAAVFSSYKASRNYTTANYDSLEVNAQHTAKYLMREIKKENACVAEQPARADGKTWAEYDAARKAAAAGQAQSL